MPIHNDFIEHVGIPQDYKIEHMAIDNSTNDLHLWYAIHHRDADYSKWEGNYLMVTSVFEVYNCKQGSHVEHGYEEFRIK